MIFVVNFVNWQNSTLNLLTKVFQEVTDRTIVTVASMIDYSALFADLLASAKSLVKFNSSLGKNGVLTIADQDWACPVTQERHRAVAEMEALG